MNFNKCPLYSSDFKKLTSTTALLNYALTNNEKINPEQEKTLDIQNRDM